MVTQLTLDQIRRFRFQNQLKIQDNVAQIVKAACALQSQELPAAHLAIRARTTGLTLKDVKYAREVERSIILTWTMRGTMHLVSSEDIHWQLELVGQHFINKTERRYKQLGLDAVVRQHTLDIIPTILSKEEALTRAQLAQALAKYDIPVDGQAIHHLVRFAALSGLICFGAEDNGELTYVLLDDWLSAAQSEFSEEHALTELARRYFETYAPTTLKDFISWSGLGTKQAKIGFNAIADDLAEVETPIGTNMMFKHQLKHLDNLFAEDTVHLLPRFDNYLLAYESRAFMVDETFAKQIHPGGGIIRPTLVVNGEAKGIWHLERKRSITSIIVQAFNKLEKQYLPVIEADVLDIGRFLDEETQLVIEVPLVN